MPDSVRDREYTLRMRCAGMMMNEGPCLVTLTASLARSSEPGPNCPARAMPKPHKRNKRGDTTGLYLRETDRGLLQRYYNSSVSPNSLVPLAVDPSPNLVLFISYHFLRCRIAVAPSHPLQLLFVVADRPTRLPGWHTLQAKSAVKDP